MLAPWIVSHFGEHRIYVEPFGGAASVLLRKPRSYAEVYNDLDGDAVNLFRLLRSEEAAKLVDALRLTPFARDEFELAYQGTAEPLERARRLVIRSFMGFGSDGHNIAIRTGFRSNTTRAGTTPAMDWHNYPDSLAEVIERLRGVQVESRPAVEVMQRHDGPQTLHYADPPYLHETRKGRGATGIKNSYAHEMSEEQHLELLGALRLLEGMVVLSGYPSELYDSYLAGWLRIERKALADGARARTEVLWLNGAAEAAWKSHGIFAPPELAA
jgi:DNA adenine methylase